jgi:hypothetical protein
MSTSTTETGRTARFASTRRSRRTTPVPDRSGPSAHAPCWVDCTTPTSAPPEAAKDLPSHREQALNAARCAALGLARVLDPQTATPAAVRDAVRAMLGDSVYRTAAARVRDEARALPGPEHAVALLERLATERRPLLGEAHREGGGGTGSRSEEVERVDGRPG